MKIPFLKYHGAGNDFILCDDLFFGARLRDSSALIGRLCHRHLGIGADGLIVLERLEEGFHMHYFNADGHPSSLCGNGSRCAVAVARSWGWFDREGAFRAFDGWHQAAAEQDNSEVSIKMKDLSQWEWMQEDCYLDTGSPHYVRFLEELGKLNVVEEGKKIRYSKPYQASGVNVNFACPKDGGLQVYTYERGVENETLSCGTGVTAAALAFAQKQNLVGDRQIKVYTKGGHLTVYFHFDGQTFKDIWLKGPVQRVFEGFFSLEHFKEL
jgi:diaminopimelate epimerase